jgi:hypothetical protein
VKLDGTFLTLTDAIGITLNGGSVQGAGKISATVSGSGAVKASGGTLELANAIGASSGTFFQVANGASNILQVDSTVGAGNTFAFLGAAGQLALVNDTGFNDTISGLNAGANKTNFVDVRGHTVTINAVSGQGTTSGKITLSDGAILDLTSINSTNWAANTISDGAGGTDVFLTAPAGPSQSAAVLNDFGWAQGWGSPNNPRTIGFVDNNGAVDYIGFGFNAVFVAYGGTFSDGQGHLGPGFSSAMASVNDFGTNEGYAATVQRGAAATGAGVGDSFYGQGFAGVFWYAATSAMPQLDAVGQTYDVLTYQTSPNFYGNFGSQQGWTPDNGFQILKAKSGDGFASILGFGNDGIIVGPEAFAPGATAAGSYLIPFGAGNNSGWKQSVDIRSFTDAGGKVIDLNGDGIADFVGMGPQGLVFALGNASGPGGGYGLGPLQTAHVGAGGTADLGEAQG